MLCAVGLDVEDAQLPQSDDAALWFARFFAEQGLRPTFFVTGDKIDVLKQRGRTDVLQAIGRMHVAFHSAHHSRHPTVFELTQGREHLDAVQALVDREFSAIRRIEQTFDRPIRMFGQTGGSFAPAMAEALSDHNLGYAYMPSLLGPKEFLFWWRNCLVFPRAAELPYVDDCLDDDAEVNRRIDQLDGAIARAAAVKAPAVYFFAAHPVRTICRGFPDLMSRGLGVNGPADSPTPPLYTDEQVQRGRRNFARSLDYLSSHRDLELMSFEQVMDRVRRPDHEIDPDDLQHWCVTYERSQLYPVATPRLTAGEGLCALVDRLNDRARAGKPPRCAPFGPLRMSREGAACYRVQRGDLLAALPAFEQQIQQRGRLPPEVVVGGQRMGLGNFARAVLRFWRDPRMSQTTVYGESPFLSVGPPAAGEVVRSLYGWPVHDMNIQCQKAIEQTLLATWCLRPAELTRR